MCVRAYDAAVCCHIYIHTPLAYAPLELRIICYTKKKIYSRCNLAINNQWGQREKINGSNSSSRFVLPLVPLAIRVIIPVILWVAAEPLGCSFGVPMCFGMKPKRRGLCVRELYNCIMIISSRAFVSYLSAVRIIRIFSYLTKLVRDISSDTYNLNSEFVIYPMEII